MPSFVPVRIEAASTEAATRVSLDVQARLPNGVLIDLRGCDVEQAGRVIETLGSLRCSASTKA